MVQAYISLLVFDQARTTWLIVSAQETLGETTIYNKSHRVQPNLGKL